jgi:DNA repair protein RadC
MQDRIRFVKHATGVTYVQNERGTDMISNYVIGHRKRLRERFIKNKFEGFHEYEVLEIMLTFIFRQGDVKQLAKKLLEQFGSFAQVLDAPVTELEKVKGLGVTSALSLKIFREFVTYYHNSNVFLNRIQLTKMDNLIELLRSNLCDKENEVLFAIFLNARNEILDLKVLSEGTVSQASAFPRRIAEEAISIRATSVILAHNHPGGIAEPSEQDLIATVEIKKALSLIDVELQDHIILTNHDFYSFKTNLTI